MKKQYVYSFSISGNLTIELEDDEDTDQRVKDILKGMSSTNEEVKDYSCYDVELTLECEEEDEDEARHGAIFALIEDGALEEHAKEGETNGK